MPGRRELTFHSLDEVMPEVDRLIAGGHTTVGRWSLGEILQHLARTLRMVLEPPMKPAPWIVRRTVGPLIFRRILGTGRMAAGIKGPAVLMPQPGRDARAEAEGLRATIRRFQEQLPERFEHTFFGPVTGADFARLQCIHCAHHLSFVLPESGSPGGPSHAASGAAPTHGA
jgi:hypothetical protein